MLLLMAAGEKDTGLERGAGFFEFCGALHFPRCIVGQVEP